MADLFSAHGMMASTFRGDAHESAYLEGQRSVLLRILKILGTKPAALKEIIEQIERENV